MCNIRHLAGWLALLGGVMLGLLILTAAAETWWLSWGPPSEYRKAWEQRAIVNLGWALICFVTGPMVFLSLKGTSAFRWSKLHYAWLVVVLVCLGYPKAREWIAIDRCLDAGGSWQSSHFDCQF